MFLTFRIDYRFLNIFWCLLCSLSFMSIFFVVLYLFYGPCCLILNKWMEYDVGTLAVFGCAVTFRTERYQM